MSNLNPKENFEKRKPPARVIVVESESEAEGSSKHRNPRKALVETLRVKLTDLSKT